MKVVGNDKVSIIVPIFNIELYLPRCIKSLINQKYEMLEIILIDDGSTDASSNICDKYKTEDDRIKVIHKVNEGLSSARNCGLRICTGKFVTFVDGDDYVSYNYIYYLVEIIKKTNSQIAVCQYKIGAATKYNFLNMNGNNNFICWDKMEALERLLYQKGISSSVCAKLYERELWEFILFPSKRIHEDVATFYKILDKCKKIVVTQSVHYYYFQRIGSIINTKFSSSKMDYLKSTQECIDYMKCFNVTFIDAAISRHFSACFELLSLIPYGKIRDKDYLNIKIEIEKYRITVIRDGCSRMKNKIAAILSILGVQFVWGLLRIGRYQNTMILRGEKGEKGIKHYNSNI